MKLDDITPVILTLNESANIGRTLDRLAWARRIVVVDSFSEDDTAAIVARYAQATLFRRRFDSHANQWNFAIRETGIDTRWILALDADFVVPEALTGEIGSLAADPEAAGYRVRFVYCIYGSELRSNVYPAKPVLFRAGRAAYVQDGHTQQIRIDGPVRVLSNRIRHDDRKPLAVWLAAQARYMRLETRKLLSVPALELGIADRLRRAIVVAPAAIFIYCLFVRGGILDGRAGLFYAIQRAVAESILSLYLLKARLGIDNDE